MKYIIKLLAISSLLLSFNSFAKDPIYTGYFSSEAVSGYDTVAYFTQSKAVKGLKKFSHEYQGEDWILATASIWLYSNKIQKNMRHNMAVTAPSP